MSNITKQNGPHNKEYNRTVNQALTAIFNYYKTPAVKLIRHLMEKHNYSTDKIGEIIGISGQAIRNNWTKLPGEEKDNE